MTQASLPPSARPFIGVSSSPHLVCDYLRSDRCAAAVAAADSVVGLIAGCTSLPLP